MRVAVVGGGPSGLVTLKYLLEAHKFFSIPPIEAILFETENDIGGTFRYRSYEDAELVSSRQLTLFSDFRIDDSQPDFITTEAYCEYLKRYCDCFGLWPHIQLSTTVDRIARAPKGCGHRLHFTRHDSSKAQEEQHFDAVAICSGPHVTPNVPEIAGIESVPKFLHSSQFKQRDQFGTQKDILILGAGETAMDIAYLAVTSPTKSVTLSHQNGWQNAPKRLPDPIINGDFDRWRAVLNKYGPMPPSDCGFASLFDTAYVHPVLDNSGLLWDYYTTLTCKASKLLSGTTWGIAQWVGELDESRRHGSKIIPNKSNNAMPYINIPYLPADMQQNTILPHRKLALPPVDTGDRHIALAPWPEKIDIEGRVHFQKTERPESVRMENHICKPDLIVFATGYTQTFPFLPASEDYPTPADADMRSVWKTTRPDIGFIGFVRPNFGAIPPLAELQAQLWIANLLGQVPRNLCADDSYKLRVGPQRRIQYAVDHDSYAYRLALDLGSAPSIMQVAAYGSTVFGTWALGPNFVTKFRLIGPWRWSGAAEVMRTELWHVIQRRRSWFVWLFFSILPMSMFGMLNLWLYVVLLPVDAVKWFRNAIRNH